MIFRLWKVQVGVKRLADMASSSCLIICWRRERDAGSPRSAQLPPCSQRWEPEKGGKKPFKDISPVPGIRMSLTVNVSEATSPGSAVTPH